MSPNFCSISFGGMWLLLFTLSFSGAYFILMGIYRWHWCRLKKPLSSSLPGAVAVSVVIAARNEESNLPHLLADLKAQDYPPELLEVIVVDDFSEDRTAAIAQQFGYHVMQPAVPAAASSKKAAIAAGVSAATGTYILTTDADCRIPKNWVRSLTAFISNNKLRFVAAPVVYQHHRTLLGVLQQLDFLMLQGITGAGHGSGLHLMCNGASLAYDRKSFNAVGGFAGIDKKASGDDMLLLQKIAKQFEASTGYLKDDEAIVSTAPAPDWGSFLQQRRRWASKTTSYNDAASTAILSFVLAQNLFFVVLLMAACVDLTNLWLLVLYWAAKSVAELWFLYPVAAFFTRKAYLPLLPLLQPVHVLYTVAVGVLSQFGSYRWKGRQLR